MALIGIKSKTATLLKPDTTPITEVAPGQLALTERAAARLKPGSLLRVALQGGGCSGLKPYFTLEEAPKETDKVFQSLGVSICVDPRSLSVIGGSIVDFDNGFKIKSQNLKKSCSCGESFSLV